MPALPARAMLLVTCRAEPDSTDQHNHVSLPAGHYRLLVVERMPTHPPVPAAGPRHCRTCEAAPEFITRRHVRDLPSGDIILAVHGFNCTQQSGIETAFNIRDVLAAWGLPLGQNTGMVPNQGDHKASPLHTRGQRDSVGAPFIAPAQVVGFTWPCEHTLFPGYMADKEAVARFAAFSLANLITDLRAAEPGRRIHIVAHSMGCFLTLKALNMLAVLHAPQMGLREPPVTSVIWLAPDINADALERSTPDSARVRSWRHPARLLFVQHVARAFARPRPEPDVRESAGKVPASALVAGQEGPLANHPLDGYGYAALDATRQIAIYCSLRDEALWASPLANYVTEESGSASGSIRLGWCGPLHPQLMMVPDGRRRREVALVDCTPVICEHGGYFFEPAVQRDLAARLEAAQAIQRREASAAVPSAATATGKGNRRQTRPRLSRPAVPSRAESLPVGLTPPPERKPLDSWHTGYPLQYPSRGGKLPPGLTLWQIASLPAGDPLATTPPPGAPSMQPGSITARFAGLWRFPLTRGLMSGWIALWRWYYRV